MTTHRETICEMTITVYNCKLSKKIHFKDKKLKIIYLKEHKSTKN